MIVRTRDLGSFLIRSGSVVTRADQKMGRAWRRKPMNEFMSLMMPDRPYTRELKETFHIRPA
jgi:hypothetical protein